MPGNRTVFNDAIKRGHNAAWDGKWKKAAEEYRRALAEFPDDLTVRASLAQALEELGQWESALQEHTGIAKIHPQDPLPLMRIAALQEKMRRPAEAAGTYLAAADLFLQIKQTPKAIEAWRKVSTLEPDRTDIHQKLAEVYGRNGQAAQAADEFVAIARIHLKRGDAPKARALADQALSLNPKNQPARALIDELTREAAPPVNAGLSPVDEAEKAALSRLAETVLEEPAPRPVADATTPAPSQKKQLEIDTLITRAVDAQMHGRVNEAIDAYRKLLAANVARPEIKFNLGLLLFETMRYDDAIELLRQTVADKNYALASHYALGQCFRAQGKMDNAVEHFLQVIKIVDLASVNRDQADDLISVYEGLAESYAAKGDRAQAETFSRTLEEFLTSRGWEDKVSEVRRHLDSLREANVQVNLAEAIEMPESSRVLEALALAQEYLRRDKLGAASDECYRAIELAPNYLPGHIRLAEILTKQGRTAEAQVKYQVLADLCLIRDDVKRAESMYRSSLKIAPDDVTTRSKLIDLCIQQQRVDEALNQYLELGEMYIRQNQLAKAAEKLSEGARYAARLGVANSYAMTLRHRLAEVRVRQADFKNALSVYQEIRQQSPDDERARFYIIDLEYRLGHAGAALDELDALIAHYQAQNEPRKALSVVEALAQNYPSEPTLTMRLAQQIHLAGNTPKAIELLDGLADSLLTKGRASLAADAVRLIIDMNPPRVDEYKAMLAQLSE